MATNDCKITMCLVLLKTKYTQTKSEQNFDRIYKIINDVVNENCHNFRPLTPVDAAPKTFSGLAIKIILKAIELQEDEYLSLELKEDGNKQVVKVLTGSEGNRNLIPIPNPIDNLFPRLITNPADIIPLLSGSNSNYYYMSKIKNMVRNFDVRQLMSIRNNYIGFTMNQYPKQISYLLYILRYIKKTDKYLDLSVQAKGHFDKYIVILDEVYIGSKTDDYTYDFEDFMQLLPKSDDAYTALTRSLFKDNDLIEFLVGPFELSAFSSQKIALQAIYTELSASDYLTTEVKSALHFTFDRIQSPDTPVNIKKIIKNPLSHMYDEMKSQWN